jgi:hypothetical protein
MEESKVENEGRSASRLDTETSLAPVPPLGVVPVGACQSLVLAFPCCASRR